MNSVYEFKFEERKYEPRKVVYLFADKNSALVKYNPVSLVFGGLLMFYQKVISQQLASNCPYEISCSEFSRLSIKEYGLIKGVSLSADRLTRCTQFTKIDINPSWFNDDYRIIDPVERWALKYYKHDHDHNHKHKH
jgi:putative component of membrane protein insertase Oxa1/YidC/SpoIIIJ protein YidD